MKRLAGSIAFFVVAGLLARPARAEVYTWVDEKGTVHFEQSPPPDKRVKRLDLPRDPDPDPAAPSPAKDERPAPPKEPPAAPPKVAPTVELFGTSWCPYCVKAREFFRKKGIAVVDYDIDKDKSARRRKVELTGNEAIPTVVIGGRVIQGYLPAEYEKALGH